MIANRPNNHPSPKNERLRKIGRFLIEESKTPDTPAGQARAETSPPTVFAYFKSRWGEVDGYLPVLHKFKEMHPDWRIIAVIGSEHMANTVDDQAFLYNELKDTVDTLIRLTPKSPSTSKQIFYRKWIRKTTSWYHRKCVRFSWRKVFEFLNDEEIKVIIKDHGHDDGFLLHIQSVFPAAICVAAPHGTGIYIESPEANFRTQKNSKIDLLLIGDEAEIPCFLKTINRTGEATIQAVGRPRYDRWWIEHLAQLPCFTTSEEHQLAQKSQRVFLFATRGPSSSFFPTESFEYLIKTVAETVLSEPGNLLLIKPHPQQDLEFIQSTMAQYPTNSWKISSLQTMQLAQISDFVICMLSGVILDALAVGKPTVEYFQYTQKLPCFFQNENGKTVSIYGKLGLAVTAERQEELKALIDDYFSENKHSDQWEQQQLQASKFMKLDNQSSMRSVDAIQSLLEKQSTQFTEADSVATSPKN